jgi:hypothetical protein
VEKDSDDEDEDEEDSEDAGKSNSIFNKTIKSVFFVCFF